MPADRGRTTGRARVTIAEVAREAGVSLSTASEALRGIGRVSDATRVKVTKAAERLGYRPSRAARSLRLGRQGAVALALPPYETRPGEFLEVDYYMGIAAGMTAAAFEHGMVVSLIPDERVRVGEVADLVDGVILSDPDLDDVRLGALLSHDVPVVTIDHDLGRPDHRWWLTSDHRENTRTLLDHVAGGGARRIVLYSCEQRWSWLVETEESFTEWMTERGLEVVIRRLDVQDRFTAGAQVTAELIASATPPEAILATAEHFALGALACLRARGVAVPDDVQLVAAVDGAGARFSDPSITAIDLQPGEQGRVALELLAAQLDGEVAPEPPVIPAVLRERGSTRTGRAPRRS